MNQIVPLTAKMEENISSVHWDKKKRVKKEWPVVASKISVKWQILMHSKFWEYFDYDSIPLNQLITLTSTLHTWVSRVVYSAALTCQKIISIWSCKEKTKTGCRSRDNKQIRNTVGVFDGVCPKIMFFLSQTFRSACIGKKCFCLVHRIQPMKKILA